MSRIAKSYALFSAIVLLLPSCGTSLINLGDSDAPVAGAADDSAMKWPLVDGYFDPNQIIYDKAHFEKYLAYYANRATICGIGPQCEMMIGGAARQFRSGIDYGHIGNRFHLDHLRRFLRSRIDGTKQVFSDDRAERLNPYERDISFCVGLIRDAQAAEALPELNALLSDRNQDIKYATIWALADLGPEARGSVPKLGDVLESDLARDASQALAKIGEAAIPLLTERVNAGGTDARIYSIEALGTIGPPAHSAVDELIKALYEKRDVTDRSGYISSYAATALGRIQDARALEHLRKMDTAKNHDVRSASQLAIRMIEEQAK